MPQEKEKGKKRLVKTSSKQKSTANRKAATAIDDDLWCDGPVSTKPKSPKAKAGSAGLSIASLFAPGGARKPPVAVGKQKGRAIDLTEEEVEDEAHRNGKSSTAARSIAAGATKPKRNLLVTFAAPADAAGPIEALANGSRKRPREAASASEGGSASGAEEHAWTREQALWPDKYRPQSAAELAVHAKKLEEVREWLAEAIAAHRSASSGGGSSSGSHWRHSGSLLVLAGPSGIGKSTMVRVLAEEMGVDVLEWSDTSGQLVAPFRGPGESYDAIGAPSRRPHELGPLYTSQVDQFNEFLRAASYTPLALTSESKQAPLLNGSSDGDDALNGAAKHLSPKSRIVLIEDLPSTTWVDSNGGDGREGKGERMRAALADFLQASPCPAVLILSEAGERDKSSHRQRLEQLLSREMANWPSVQVVACNPVNATLLRKTLWAVLEAEGLDASDSGGGGGGSGSNATEAIEEIILSCGGDLRHALMTLQVRVGCAPSAAAARSLKRKAGGAKGAKRKTAASGKRSKGRTAGAKAAAGAAGDVEKPADETEIERDRFLTHFHALGKLLYSKRVEAAAGSHRSKGAASSSAAAAAAVSGGGKSDVDAEPPLPPLKFVPEDILERSDMPVDRAASFLQFHCPDFYSDIDDLARGLEKLSDADLFVATEFDTSQLNDRGDGAFPMQYAASLASRAVAATNRHPAPSKMRTFGAPRSFEVRRAQKINSDTLDSYSWRVFSELGVPWAVRNSSEVLNTDYVPAVRTRTGCFELVPALEAFLQLDEAGGGWQGGGGGGGAWTAGAVDDEDDFGDDLLDAIGDV